MATHPDWSKVKNILQAALELPEDERSAYLDQECGSDQELRTAVERLLSADEEKVGFLDQPAGSLLAEDAEASSLEGQCVGPYRLVRELGRGGLGSVYLAVRADDEFQRQVAIKLLKRGMDTDEIVRRFRKERQILANLDHSNITRMYEGSSTEDGRPYFVMEYVEGEPIDRYCNRESLNVEDRLQLFRQVCSAVHFAHRNLVLHRDLKPSNILVAANGEPKLLDFGIAKLLTSETADPSTLTVQGFPVMTPEYASPEQVTGKTLTTASDVYSLGVVLYELLTGRRPYSLRVRTRDEVQKAHAEQSPEKPSTAVTLDQEATRDGGSSQGGKFRIGDYDLPKLRRQLAGDLDTIVLMALRHEPERRYSSAEQFSEDIERHLQGLPVKAQEDTLLYRSERFISRHRFGLATAALIFLLITASAFTFAFQQRQTAQERDRAELVSNFLVEIFNVANPQEPEGPATARDLLDNGAKRIETELQDQPEVRAEVMETIANAYVNLASYERAQSLLTKALEIRESLYDPDHFKVAEICHSLGALYFYTGDYSSSETYLDRSLEIYEKQKDRALDLAAAANTLAVLYKKQGQYDIAESLYKKTLAIHEQEAGVDSQQVAASLNNLASLYKTLGRYPEAEQFYRRSLAVKEKVYGRSHNKVAITLKNLGVLFKVQRKHNEAEEFYKRALTIEEEEFGSEHPSVAQTLNNLAILYYVQEKYDLAEPLLKRALKIREKKLGVEHPVFTESLHNLGALRYKQGKFELSEGLLKRAFDLREATLGADHRLVALTAQSLGTLYRERGEQDLAGEYLRRSLSIREKVLGEEHPEVAESLHSLAKLCYQQNDLETARAYFERAIDIRQKAFGEEHPKVEEFQAEYSRLFGK